MLDYLPAPVRHAVLVLAGSLLGWAATAIPAMDVPVPVAMVLGTAITIAGTYLTPLTRQYGVGVDAMPEIEDFWSE